MFSHLVPPWPLRVLVLLLVGLATITAAANLPFNASGYNDFCSRLHSTGPDILGLWGPNESLMALVSGNRVLSVQSTSYFPNITIDPQDPELLGSSLPEDLVAGPGSFMLNSKEDSGFTLVYFPDDVSPTNGSFRTATYFSMSVVQQFDALIGARSLIMEQNKLTPLTVMSSTDRKWYTMSTTHDAHVLAFQYRHIEHFGSKAPILAITGFHLNKSTDILISASSPFSKHQKVDKRYNISIGFTVGHPNWITKKDTKGIFIEKATKLAYYWRLQEHKKGDILEVLDQQSFGNYFKCLPFPTNSNRVSYLTYAMVGGSALVVVISVMLFFHPNLIERNEGKTGGLTENKKAQSKTTTRQDRDDPSATDLNVSADGNKV